MEIERQAISWLCVTNTYVSKSKSQSSPEQQRITVQPRIGSRDVSMRSWYVSLGDYAVLDCYRLENHGKYVCSTVRNEDRGDARKLAQDRSSWKDALCFHHKLLSGASQTAAVSKSQEDLSRPRY